MKFDKIEGRISEMVLEMTCLSLKSFDFISNLILLTRY